MFTQNFFVSDEMINAKCIFALNETNFGNSGTSEFQLKLNNGWLHKFEERDNFKRFRSHGEYFGLRLENWTEEFLGITRE